MPFACGGRSRSTRTLAARTCLTIDSENLDWVLEEHVFGVLDKAGAALLLRIAFNTRNYVNQRSLFCRVKRLRSISRRARCLSSVPHNRLSLRLAPTAVAAAGAAAPC